MCFNRFSNLWCLVNNAPSQNKLSSTLSPVIIDDEMGFKRQTDPGWLLSRGPSQTQTLQRHDQGCREVVFLSRKEFLPRQSGVWACHWLPCLAFRILWTCTRPRVNMNHIHIFHVFTKWKRNDCLQQATCKCHSEKFQLLQTTNGQVGTL